MKIKKKNPIYVPKKCYEEKPDGLLLIGEKTIIGVIVYRTLVQKKH